MNVLQIAILVASLLTAGPKDIAKIEDIEVSCPEGTAPRLPWRVWTTYSDGSADFRQVRWDNCARDIEECQASVSAGSSYTVEGIILGEDMPVTATVNVTKAAYKTPAPTPKAHTFPLSDVSIEGDNWLTEARDMAIRHLLDLDVSQQLYNYRDTYGLSTEGYTRSNGWDSPWTKLKGHGTGHYLSALAFAFACASNPADKDSLRANIRRMVDEMRECQERTFVWHEELGRYWEARDFAPEEQLRELKGTWEAFDEYKQNWEDYGYGYLNAIPAQHPVLVEMYRPYNNSDWVWAPYYTIHKQLAGLIDIATYVDDRDIADKALLIARDMGLWVWNRLHYRSHLNAEGSKEERRARPGNRYEMWNIYIAGENGGMGESMARLSEMVSDPEDKAKLLEGASFFDNPSFFDALSHNVDDIRGRHANQHIPQIVGALRTFLGNADPCYYDLSLNFWQMIQGRYRYATGGVGNSEMFREPYTQIASMVSNPDPTLNETCCAYNMAKLTKDLNCYDPDNAAFMDYYERVLYNQIVGSLDHDHWGVTYHYAVGLNASKPFGNRTPQESCCGGTGSENHVKYQEAIYFADGKTLWVGLYIPSRLDWKEKGVVLRQESSWPAESSRILVEEGKGRFSLKLRVPYWATEGCELRVNGKKCRKALQAGSYARIRSRNWRAGDVVEIKMPFVEHIDYAPDKLDGAWVAARMHGPLVMTATGFDDWDKATIGMEELLGDEIPFLPDYLRNEHSTHYFRIKE